MANRIGPAVGARGQIGYAEEGSWGKTQVPVNKFFEMRSEGLRSELGSLVSASLRSDRAVHKRASGTEAAGGDVVLELGAAGFTKIIKHALGKCTSKRVDEAFILQVTDGAATTANLVIGADPTTGLATTFVVTLSGGTGAGVNLDLTSASYDTIGEVMTQVNGGSTGLRAWSPYSWRRSVDGSAATTLQTADYVASSTLAKYLQPTPTTGAVPIVVSGNSNWPNKTLPIFMGWGVYQHVIDAHSSLPAGITIEVGRDVAAFVYAGCKVNTFNITANPNEFLTATANFMAKGATTAGGPVAESGNTNFNKEAFKIRYIGSQSAFTLAYNTDTTGKILVGDCTGDNNLDFRIYLGWGLQDGTANTLNQTWYDITTVGGLVQYLLTKKDSLGNPIFEVEMAPYADPNASCSKLAVRTAVDIKSTLTYTKFYFTNNSTTGIPGCPVAWGDYKGTDKGVSKTFYVKVTTPGKPDGTAVVQFSADGISYGNAATLRTDMATSIRTGSNVDSGFTIYFPDVDSNLATNDIWRVTTIRDQATASYAVLDPFSGFQGALTIDGTTAPIMSWNCTVNNNLYGDKYHLGERVRGMLPEQNRSTEGTVGVEFDDLDLYRKFLNRVSADLSMTFTASDYISNGNFGASPTQYAMTIRQPKIEFTGTTPTIAGPQIMTVDVPYVALYDDTNAIPDIRITITNNERYV